MKINLASFTMQNIELLREEVLDRIISIMGEIKKKEQRAIYDKYEASVKQIINKFAIKNALDLLSLIYYDTYFIKDPYLNDHIRKHYYEILNIIKMNIMRPEAVIKKDIINCVTETAV